MASRYVGCGSEGGYVIAALRIPVAGGVARMATSRLWL